MKLLVVMFLLACAVARGIKDAANQEETCSQDASSLEKKISQDTVEHGSIEHIKVVMSAVGEKQKEADADDSTEHMEVKVEADTKDTVADDSTEHTEVEAKEEGWSWLEEEEEEEEVTDPKADEELKKTGVCCHIYKTKGSSTSRNPHDYPIYCWSRKEYHWMSRESCSKHTTSKTGTATSWKYNLCFTGMDAVKGWTRLGYGCGRRRATDVYSLRYGGATRHLTKHRLEDPTIPMSYCDHCEWGREPRAP